MSFRNVSAPAVIVGLALTFAVNGAFLFLVTLWEPARCSSDADCDAGLVCALPEPSPTPPEGGGGIVGDPAGGQGVCLSPDVLQGNDETLLMQGSVRHGMCGERRRCTLPEQKFKRRDIEETPADELNLVAQLVPALGMKEIDPSKLPKLQTYEQEKIVKSGVNLDKRNKPPKKKLRKKYDAKKARRDPKSLEDILKRNHDEDDLRRKATRIQDLVGDKDGEIGGANVRRMGNRYAWKVRRRLRPIFRAPNVSDEALKQMVLVVKVTQMRADGAILKYRITHRSPKNTDAFTSAALAVIELFVKPKRGEPSKTLPEPAPELLRYFNQKGLKLRLTGKDMVR